MNYNQGDIVILPFPFVTQSGVKQKAHPALIISDHSIERRYNDVILVAITSQRIDEVKQTELLIEEVTPNFKQTGLVKTSVVRCEYIMTIPAKLIVRELGKLYESLQNKVDNILKLSLGLKDKL
ncbi:MAG: type II toxin-antitoxin system PemK/MazF family toxin [Candidatus Cloacimonetes bacterium]|nr:type II toxin-antitoxin system PemK/MazF family toxin [Candidatus Cloacimonadota bacterium]